MTLEMRMDFIGKREGFLSLPVASAICDVAAAMAMRLLTTLACLSVIGAPIASAQEWGASTPAVRLNHLFNDPAPTPFLNGGILVSEHGHTVFRTEMGFADFRLGTPVRAVSVFQTASASKPFTATAILQLRDARRLGLNDPVARYLPGFPFPDIQIRHLLSHTSGLPDLELFEELIVKDPAHIVSSGDLVPALRAWRQPLPFRPGERFQYSNVNYQLLALIVEKAGRQQFGSYVRDHIFAPAGMRSSYVLGTRPLTKGGGDPVTDHMHVVMYRPQPEDVSHLQLSDAQKMRPFRYELGNLGSTLGDQNLFTTLDDLARFDRALTNGRLLSLKTQEEAYAPVRLNDGNTYLDAEEYQLYGVRCSYGLGWEVCEHPRYGRLVGHAGFNRGIFTMLYRNLTRGQLIVMFDNGDTSDFTGKFVAVTKVLNGEGATKLDRRRSLTRAYGEVLVRDGPTAALLFYLERCPHEDLWATTRGGMNALGYDLLRNGYPALALEPFRLNIIAYPSQAGGYDSYGEALATNGRTAEAIIAYRRSLALNPDNANGREKLKDLEAQSGLGSK